jgi:hypothetical protein
LLDEQIFSAARVRDFRKPTCRGGRLLYHLNAMEDPFWYTYPPEWKNTIGPRNLVHSFATDVDDPTEQPRWGKIGKQKIIDEGPLPPEPVAGIKYNMGTFDEVITENTIAFMDKAKKANKPFFVWMNPTRAHVLTHLSPKYDACATRKPTSGWKKPHSSRWTIISASC